MIDTLLIPLAGYGRRFQEEGYCLPKQLLSIQGKTTLEYSLESISAKSKFNVVVLLRSGLITKHDIRSLFNKYFNRECIFIEVVNDTRGSLETCLLAKNYINKDSKLHIYTLDVRFKPSVDISQIDLNKSDASISLVKTNNPGYCYAQIDESSQKVNQIAEKKIISNYGATGLYSFKNAETFFKLAKKHIQNGLIFNKEFYISDIYKVYLEMKKNISFSLVDSIYSFGTPKEYEWCIKNIKKHIVNIGLASDHSGFKEKKILEEFLSYKGFNLIDTGCFGSNDCDYPDFVGALCQNINMGIVDFGISICRSGQGVNIAANKFANIRSALYTSNEDWKIALRHNLPNHLAVPALKLKEVMTQEFCDNLTNVNFEGGRHQDRLMNIEK